MGGAWMLAAATAAALWLPHGAAAHEVQPAIMDVTVADPTTLDVRLNAEAILAGIDLSTTADTNDAPGAARYDALRALAPDALAAEVEAAFPSIAGALLLEGLGPPSLVSVEVVPEPDDALPRDTRVVMEAALEGPPAVGFPEAYGELILRQEGEAAFAGLLSPGEISPPLEAGSAEGAPRTFARYVVSGFEHIVPRGLDHILFVLGLFFYSRALGPLLWQVTAFTLAHTATLASATLGLVSVPGSIVEPLIALSIAYVGVENVLRPAEDRPIAPWRPALVFGFGLLHGLGFAAALSEVEGGGGLVPRLLGFNLGVELGQLAVIAAAFVVLALPFGRMSLWRPAIAVPASGAIAAVGLFWAVERTVAA